MYEQMLKELIDLILNTDPMEADVRMLYDGMQKYIAPLADALHVARIDLRIETAPNVYELNGRVDTFTNFYHDGVAPKGQAMVLTYPELVSVSGSATIYPWAGHAWSEEEKKQISAVASLLNIEFSRCNMIRRQEKAPFIDLLTGLSNNPGVFRFGARLERVANMTDYAGCFINLKNFKYINQHLGQTGGDAAMRQYAFRLYGFLDPQKEIIARLGGDNFFALVRKAHLEQFLSMAVSLSVTVDRGEEKSFLPISSWIGVYPAREGDTVPIILNNASSANEQAKRSHITVSYFDVDRARESLRAKKVAQIFPQALQNREFVPYYQPKVLASNGRLYGCEALVRWNREGEQISPADFVPVAERSGLVTQLDQYMLEAVCRDIRSWLDEGIEPVAVSINFSQRDFFSPTLCRDTLDTIRKYEVDPKYIEIEITESSFFENYDALEEFIGVMHENGIKVSLDDFGTGYSSLTMFKNLDLDTVKLDKSFFDDLDDKDDTDRIILRSVADMLNKLNTASISEGVETAEQLDFVKEIGCDIVQGFYYDKPLAYDEFTRRLRVRHYEPDGSLSAG